MFFIHCDLTLDPLSKGSGFFLLNLDAPPCLRTGQSVTLSVNSGFLDMSPFTFVWNTSGGVLSGEGPSITFRAPDHPDTTTLCVFMMQDGHVVGLQSVTIPVYKTLVMFKADDMICDWIDQIPIAWINFIQQIKTTPAKVCIGIIGNSLEFDHSNYFSALKELHESGQFEFWNHGYDHTIQAYDSDTGLEWWEFCNTSFDYQKEHLLRTQTLAKDKLGVTLQAFGAPGNHNDANTIMALDEADEIRMWIFGLEPSRKMVLRRDFSTEIAPYNPDFGQFLATWNPEKEYYVFQIHPLPWGEEQLGEFKKILDYLIESRVTIVTFSDFYRLKSGIQPDSTPQDDYPVIAFSPARR